MEYIRYKHYGTWVWVRKDLRGKHQEHCLCFQCASFNPDCRKENCPRANMLHYLNTYLEMVTPVWTCPDFRPLIYERGKDDIGLNREGTQVCDSSSSSPEA